MASLNIKRLESLSLRELSLLLQKDVKNNALREITITEVRITNDLSYMTIFYTCYQTKSKDIAQKALEETKGYIRSNLAKKINARKMPELIFQYDEALEYGNRINSILASLDIKKDETEDD